MCCVSSRYTLLSADFVGAQLTLLAPQSLLPEAEDRLRDEVNGLIEWGPNCGMND